MSSPSWLPGVPWLLCLHSSFSWQRGSRYDGQIAVFGANFQEKLGHQKYLVVSGRGHGTGRLRSIRLAHRELQHLCPGRWELVPSAVSCSKTLP